MNKYELVIGGANPITTIQEVIKWASKGARYKDGTYPRLSSIPYRIEMEIETGDVLVSSATVIVKAVQYPKTQEELEAMSWDDFRKEMKRVGISGRDRQVMQNKYLKGQSQQQ